MRRIPRWIIVLLVVAGAAGVLRLTVFAPDAVKVECARVEVGPVEETVTNTRAGTVKARRRAKLSPQIGGRVVALPFARGARVEAGALLLRLDDSVQLAQVDLAEQDVRTAQAREREACLAADLADREWRRGVALDREGITSQQTLDTLESGRDRSRAGCQAARAVFDQARSQVRLARAGLALTEIRAPFAGVIADSASEVGEWITPSPPGLPIPAVLDLLDPSSLYVSAPIDEVDAERVRIGQEVRITVDSRPGETLVGRLVRVAPFVLDVLEQNRTVEVEVEPTDASAAATILPGTSADVEVVLSKSDRVLRLPTAAIAEGGKVLVVDGDRLVERTITPGLRNWRFTEVRAGLAAGERVVTARGSTDIKAGARVQVAESR